MDKVESSIHILFHAQDRIVNGRLRAEMLFIISLIRTAVITANENLFPFVSLSDEIDKSPRIKILDVTST